MAKLRIPTQQEIDLQAERSAVSEVASIFTWLIEDKQRIYNNNGIDYTVEDLLKNTPYETKIIIENGVITWKTDINTYSWLYVPRLGNEPAYFVKYKGF
jgi:phage pi2 protein 07